MSTLLTSRPAAPRERDPFRFSTTGQERLFGDGVDAPAPAPPARPPVDETASASAAAPPAPSAAPSTSAATPQRAATLDGAMTSLWARLTAGAAATCPVCEGPLEVRGAAGARVAGGRCRSCGSSLT